MKQVSTNEFLQLFCNGLIDKRLIHGCIFNISDSTGSYIAAAGNLAPEQPYFIASTTKLYATAIIMQLRSENKLGLDDSIEKYLAADIYRGIHVWKGMDISGSITIRQLMSQTSGIADYFEGKIQGISLLEKLIQGEDQSWTLSESLQLARQQKPAFAPGNHRKALYSDTNYQLLGLIIEKICGESFDTVLQTRILTPLNLNRTYMFRGVPGQEPALFYYKRNPLKIPKAMASFGPDGGIVSTATDSMVFIKAFFDGSLFPKTYLSDMYDWKRVMFPLQYGAGVMKFQLPGWMTLGRKLPTLIGHSGLCGAFDYYCPEADLYITGTVNQLHQPGTSYKAILRLIQAYQKRKKQSLGRSILQD